MSVQNKISRPCLGCNKPLPDDGQCVTPFCRYNPEYDGAVYTSKASDNEQIDHGLPRPMNAEEIDELLNSIHNEYENLKIANDRSQIVKEENLSNYNRAPGCHGDCQPVDEPGPDDVICPYCTAKHWQKEINKHRPKHKKISEFLNTDQEDAFDYLVIALKSALEQYFGDAAENIWLGAKQFSDRKGEDIIQTVQVLSNDNTTYFASVSAHISEQFRFDALKPYEKGKLSFKQEARFDEIVKRVFEFFSYILATEDPHMKLGNKCKSRYQGEDISQSFMMVPAKSSDLYGAIYLVTIAAMKNIV